MFWRKLAVPHCSEETRGMEYNPLMVQALPPLAHSEKRAIGAVSELPLAINTDHDGCIEPIEPMA